MNSYWQTVIAFFIVMFAGASLSWNFFGNFFKAFLAAPVAQWFLKRGYVKWAMKCRFISR